MLDYGLVKINLAEGWASTLGVRTSLTPKEQEALTFLAKRQGKPVTRQELAAKVWGHAPGVKSQAVAVAMRRLRTKLEPDPLHPIVLHTIHGIGFLLARTAIAREVSWPHRSPYLARPAVEDKAQDALDERWTIVTLVGPGGVGKSRIACQLAGRQLNGSVVVLMAGFGSAEDAIAAGLGLHTVNPNTLYAALVSLGSPLLVLDEAETHLVELRTLLKDMPPTLQVLLTSREPLGLETEAVVEVNPLNPTDALAFLNAKLKTSRFAPCHEQERKALAQQADGLPLALELIAADPIGLKAQVGLQTMSQTLQRSLIGLGDQMRDALSLLAQFKGPFTTEEARSLLPEPTALAVLADKSLIQRTGNAWKLLTTTATFVNRQVTEKVRDVFVEWLCEQQRQLRIAYFQNPFVAGRTWSRRMPELIELASHPNPRLTGEAIGRLSQFLSARGPFGLRDRLLSEAHHRRAYHPFLWAASSSTIMVDQLGICLAEAMRGDPVCQARGLLYPVQRHHPTLPDPRPIINALPGDDPDRIALEIAVWVQRGESDAKRDFLSMDDIAERAMAYPVLHAAIHRHLSGGFMMEGDVERGAYHGQQALELALQSDESALILKTSLSRAMLAMRDQGRVRTLAAQYEELATHLGVSPRVRAANMAYMAFAAGDISIAHDWYQTYANSDGVVSKSFLRQTELLGYVLAWIVDADNGTPDRMGASKTEDMARLEPLYQRARRGDKEAHQQLREKLPRVNEGGGMVYTLLWTRMHRLINQLG